MHALCVHVSMTIHPCSIHACTAPPPLTREEERLHARQRHGLAVRVARKGLRHRREVLDGDVALGQGLEHWGRRWLGRLGRLLCLLRPFCSSSFCGSCIRAVRCGIAALGRWC